MDSWPVFSLSVSFIRLQRNRLLTWCCFLIRVLHCLFLSCQVLSLIFSCLFMTQCKLIHVDSVLRRRVEGGLLRLCVFVCAAQCNLRVWCVVKDAWQRCEIWCRCRRLPIELVYCRVKNTVTVNILTSVGWGCYDTVTHRCTGTFVQRNQSFFGSVLWIFPASCALRCLRIMQNSTI